MKLSECPIVQLSNCPIVQVRLRGRERAGPLPQQPGRRQNQLAVLRKHLEIQNEIPKCKFFKQPPWNTKRRSQTFTYTYIYLHDLYLLNSQCDKVTNNIFTLCCFPPSIAPSIKRGSHFLLINCSEDVFCQNGLVKVLHKFGQRLIMVSQLSKTMK